MAGSRKKRQEWSWWYLLLLVQFIAVLWPPFYNRAEPALIGMPFFYWYQLSWVVIGAVLTAIVHFLDASKYVGHAKTTSPFTSAMQPIWSDR
jgi:hypothetical protein